MNLLFENKFFKLTKYFDYDNLLHIYTLYDVNRKVDKVLYSFVCDIEGNPIKEKYANNLESINEILRLYNFTIRKTTEKEREVKGMKFGGVDLNACTK